MTSFSAGLARPRSKRSEIVEAHRATSPAVDLGIHALELGGHRALHFTAQHLHQLIVVDAGALRIPPGLTSKLRVDEGGLGAARAVERGEALDRGATGAIDASDGGAQARGESLGVFPPAHRRGPRGPPAPIPADLGAWRSCTAHCAIAAPDSSLSGMADFDRLAGGALRAGGELLHLHAVTPGAQRRFRNGGQGLGQRSPSSAPSAVLRRSTSPAASSSNPTTTAPSPGRFPLSSSWCSASSSVRRAAYFEGDDADHVQDSS